jgi:hypothetical protein
VGLEKTAWDTKPQGEKNKGDAKARKRFGKERNPGDEKDEFVCYLAFELLQKMARTLGRVYVFGEETKGVGQ